jgi:pimeloyl-[acyl-carrier protein] methyl ester esterase
MLKLILLPGMEGTGKLFAPLVGQLGMTYEIEAVSYPTDECRSYPELFGIVQSAIPASDPFIIVAESFSSPLGIMYAASTSTNLKGLIICAGFASSPIRGWRRFLCYWLAPLIFSRSPSDSSIRFFLAGHDAPASLIAATRSAIASVKLSVLVHRLRTILSCDARAELNQVNVPILYLQAEQDRVIGPSCLEEIRRIKPHLSVEKYPGPHLLLQQEPERCAAAIKAFVEIIPLN